MSEGIKHDQNKIRLDLISPLAAIGLARVLTKGARKYADHNWRGGMSWSRCIGALKRHLLAYEMGIDYDVDPNCAKCKEATPDTWVCLDHTGELHIDQVQCNAMFLSEYFHTHKDKDDRYKNVKS